jgi:hypothetical protein
MLPSLSQAGNHLAQAIATVRRRLAPPATLALAVPLTRPCLSQLARSDAVLPRFVADDAVARKYLDLLGPLDWRRNWSSSTRGCARWGVCAAT